MKKLIEKDKNTRKTIRILQKKTFILKIIRNNAGLPLLIKLNASNKSHYFKKNTSKALISNRCIATINKKKFTKWVHYSRIFFLKLIKTKKIHGLTKTSW